MNPDTDAWGIDHIWTDAAGQRHEVAPDTIAALRERIGDAEENRPGPLVGRRGSALPIGTVELTLEDGTVRSVDDTVPADLPFGYHALHDADGGTRRLIVGPGRCHLPTRRAWGWAAQLYALRSADSWGIGDLGDLRELARWSAEALGAGFVLVNPLHAVVPTFPQQASPYFPTSRRFRSPLYLRVAEVPGAQVAGEELEAAATAARALNDRRQIDRDAAWRLKLSALEAIRRNAPATSGAGEFARWQAEQGRSLAQFATFCALAERFGGGWRSWPAELHDPHGDAVARYAADHGARVEFFAWLQWLTHRQLAEASELICLVQDLPIGVDPDGFDAWAWQDVLTCGVRTGAPPDEFNTRGQDWGLPPFNPSRLRAADYQPFIDTVRATIPADGGLRVDHVMGLFRLWWIPEGADPADGAYVRYPAADLLQILALESHRARAVVVGEDLGTVEPGVREAMAEHAMLSYRLLWFERDDPVQWPDLAMAAVTTHDLPTVAGLWDGSDLKAQSELGLTPNEGATNEIRNRLAHDGDLADDAHAHEAVTAAHRLLARSPCLLLSVTLDDAIGEPERPNVPGADADRANWALALPMSLEGLQAYPMAHRIAATLRAATDPTEENQ